MSTTTMTASELARNTSAALDAVSSGHQIVIERRGRPVAMLASPPLPTGAQVLGSMAGSVTILVDEDELLAPIPDWEAR